MQNAWLDGKFIQCRKLYIVGQKKGMNIIKFSSLTFLPLIHIYFSYLVGKTLKPYNISFIICTMLHQVVAKDVTLHQILFMSTVSIETLGFSPHLLTYPTIQPHSTTIPSNSLLIRGAFNPCNHHLMNE